MPFNWILIVCPSQVFAITMGITAIAAIFAYSHERTESRLPAGIMLLSIFVAFQLPILPSTPEEWHFHQHRAEYEHIVELVQQDQFTNDVNVVCPVGYEQYQGYTIDSQEFCFSISSNRNTIEFYPFNQFHSLVYVEHIRTDTHSCNSLWAYGGILEIQFNNDWYVCQRKIR